MENHLKTQALLKNSNTKREKKTKKRKKEEIECVEGTFQLLLFVRHQALLKLLLYNLCKDNYNAHPKQKLPIIKSYTNGKTLESYEWGLIPSWAEQKKDFRPLINARLETLMEKISFKKLIQTSRCVVIADGYYHFFGERTRFIIL